MAERIRLSTAAIAKYKARADGRRREIRDAGSDGLILLVHPTGAKSWIMWFRRPSGQLAKLTLGSVDETGEETAAEPVMGGHLTLAAARRLAAEVQRQRKMRLDVVADRAAAKQRSSERDANTFGQAARDFIELYAKKRHRRWKETASVLGFDPNDDLSIVRAGLAARWAGRPITEITGRDVAQLLAQIVDRGAPHSANRMLASLRKMFNWLMERYLVEANPCAKIKAPTRVEARDRFFSDDEIRRFWIATEASSPIGEPWGLFFRLLLVTGQRRDEVARMTRSEISADGSTWMIPKERSKNKTAHVVPLSPLAQEIIASVRTIAGASGFIFTTKGEAPISGFSKAKARLDRALSFPLWRIHDLRRTAATGMARLGQPVHVVERALNHKSGTIKGVAAVYNRYGYEAEVRTALCAWASLVRDITSSDATSNVITIRSSVSRYAQ